MGGGAAAQPAFRHSVSDLYTDAPYTKLMRRTRRTSRACRSVGGRRKAKSTWQEGIESKMDAATLKALQAPLKERYRSDPAAALVRSRATGRLTPGITCTVTSWNGETIAGLHAAAGGDGSKACSADLLLQALVACAGVTLNSVATHMGVRLDDAVIEAEGSWDARGTLGVSREVPVGLTDISLSFSLQPEPEPKTRAKLLELTERYCVIFHTLRHGTRIEVRPPEGDDQPTGGVA